ncbi:ty3-gypsy retrotransposon protein, partial [Tanacetum coccineum]
IGGHSLITQRTGFRVDVPKFSGSDHLSLTLLRSMRLDVPKFSSSDLDRWIFSITEYFTLLNTPVDLRLRVTGFNLEGDAAEWFYWMTRNKLITSWKGFLESMQNHFGPCKYEDPQGALSKLLQTGTVAQYQGEFEKLMNHVTYIYIRGVVDFVLCFGL